MHNDVTRLDAHEECWENVIGREKFNSGHFELFNFSGR
jgi:hypothetical protein